MRIFDYLSDGKVVKQDIIDNQIEVNQANYMTLRRLNIVFVVVCLMIFVISLFVPSYNNMSVSYGVLFFL